MNHKGRAIMTAEQVKSLLPYEDKLSKFTFTPRNIGYISGPDKEFIGKIYKEVTGSPAPCGSCESTWLCQMNVWYQASKEKLQLK